ncbi:MAG: helix-turn-helix domain-containing protein [Clostridiales bacterium]|nr:helix-turn-helix domain-containing protein [Clostridiales bacterium]
MHEDDNSRRSDNRRAVYLKIPKSTLYKLVREGKIPSQKIGRHWRFQKGAIDNWLSEVRINKTGSEGARQ